MASMCDKISNESECRSMVSDEKSGKPPILNLVTDSCDKEQIEASQISDDFVPSETSIKDVAIQTLVTIPPDFNQFYIEPILHESFHEKSVDDLETCAEFLCDGNSLMKVNITAASPTIIEEVLNWECNENSCARKDNGEFENKHKNEISKIDESEENDVSSNSNEESNERSVEKVPICDNFKTDNTKMAIKNHSQNSKSCVGIQKPIDDDDKEYTNNKAVTDLLHNGEMGLEVQTAPINTVSVKHRKKARVSWADVVITSSDEDDAILRRHKMVEHSIASTKISLKAKASMQTKSFKKHNDVYVAKKNEKRLKREKNLQIKKEKLEKKKINKKIKKESRNEKHSSENCVEKEVSEINQHNHDIMTLQNLYFLKINTSPPPPTEEISSPSLDAEDTNSNSDDGKCNVNQNGNTKPNHTRVVPQLKIPTTDIAVSQPLPIAVRKKRPPKVHIIPVVEKVKRFDKYMTHTKVVKGLQANTLIEGCLKIDSTNGKHASVLTEDNHKIKIVGIKNRNRAFDDDIVIVKRETAMDGNSPTGRVVYIKQRNHPREWAGRIEQVCAPIWRQVKYVNLLPETKCLPILQISLNDLPHKFLDDFKMYRKYIFVAKLVDWYSMAFAVGKLVKWISPEGMTSFPSLPPSDHELLQLTDETIKNHNSAIELEHRKEDAIKTSSQVLIKNKKSKATPTEVKRNFKFEKYLSYSEVMNGLRRNDLIEGRLEINPDSSKLACVTSVEDSAVVIHITEVIDRNRALDGDVVVVKVTKKARPGAASVGKVVFIKERNHPRKCIGKIVSKNESLWEQCQYVTLVPLDKKLPNIQIPISDCPSSLTKQFEQFTKCLFLVGIKDWYYATFAVGTFLQCLGLEKNLSPLVLREIEAKMYPIPGPAILKENPHVPPNSEFNVNHSTEIKASQASENVLENANQYNHVTGGNSVNNSTQEDEEELEMENVHTSECNNMKEQHSIRSLVSAEDYRELLAFLNRKKQVYEKYKSIEEVKEGLAKKSMWQGNLRINSHNVKLSYITTGDGNEDIVIKSVSSRNRALENDLVVVKVSSSSISKDKMSGKVVHIKKRNHSLTCIGKVNLTSGKFTHLGFVSFIPRDERMPIMQIPVSELPKMCDTSAPDIEDCLYLAKIVDFCSLSFTLGTIIKCLGSQSDMSIQATAILLEHDLNTDPHGSDLTANHLPDISKGISNKEMSARVDYRKCCVFTIDPLTARDLDDAMSCEVLKNGNYRIGVHISDVAHYLKEGTELDDAVLEKATSVYLVDETHHMLPRELCVHCSLLPGRDKLTFSIVWEITKYGEVLKHSFTKSVINSCCQLTYEQVQKIIENPHKRLNAVDFPDILHSWKLKDIFDRVRILYSLSTFFKNRRFDAGALRIDQPKLSFKLHPETGLPLSYAIEEHNESHSLIEEFMLLANSTVAARIYKSYPHLALLRHHPPPKSSINTVVEWFERFGLSINHASAGDLMGTLLKFEEDEAFSAVLRCHLIKTMSRALYFCADGKDPQAGHHYSLNIPLYTHFTSPIRRYADVMVHRLLASSLEYSPLPAWSSQHVQAVAAHCNEQKFKAKRASDLSAELYLWKYISMNSPLVEMAVVTFINKESLEVFLMSTGQTALIRFQEFSDSRVTLKLPTVLKQGEFPYVQAKWKKMGKSVPKYVDNIEIFRILHVELTANQKEMRTSIKVLRPIPST